MKAVLVASPRAEHQQAWAGAFAAGLRRHGWEADIEGRPRPADMLVLWGVRKRDAIRAQRARGGEVCILERGYVGDRFAWTSVSFGGGLNGRAEFRGPLGDPSRWNKHFGHHLRPWRERGETGPVLLIGQVPVDMAVIGSRHLRWLSDTAAALRRAGLPVLFRPHPHPAGASLRVPGVETVSPRQPLQEVLSSVAAVVTWNSNAGVEAALAGVPVVAVDAGSMAWPVAGHDLDDLGVQPRREEWAWALAWKQWSLDEMASGECWDAVRQRPIEQEVA